MLIGLERGREGTRDTARPAFGTWKRKYQKEEADTESSLCETSECSALNRMSVSSPPLQAQGRGQRQVVGLGSSG